MDRRTDGQTDRQTDSRKQYAFGQSRLAEEAGKTNAHKYQTAYK